MKICERCKAPLPEVPDFAPPPPAPEPEAEPEPEPEPAEAAEAPFEAAPEILDRVRQLQEQIGAEAGANALFGRDLIRLRARRGGRSGTTRAKRRGRAVRFPGVVGTLS